MIRLAAILACVLAGGALAHPSIAVPGAKLSCPAANGGPVVHVWIGVVETWEDHGITPPELDHPEIYHAQVAVPGAEVEDVVGHMPFDAGAFISCRPVDAIGFATDSARLREGYGIWRAAVLAEGARSFGISPSEVYATLVGIGKAEVGQ